MDASQSVCGYLFVGILPVLCCHRAVNSYLSGKVCIHIKFLQTVFWRPSAK